MKQKSKYTIAIDLGEHCVIAIAGSVDSDGALQIAAIASRETRGVRAGRIENIANVTEALSGVIAELEKRLNVKIQSAYGGISGEYVRCEHHSDMVAVAQPNTGVGSVDVGALHNTMRNVLAPDADTILELSPQNYIVDSRVEEHNPVGTFGKTLSSTFNFILSEKEAVKRLGNAFVQAGIDIKRCLPNAVVAAEALLTADEMEAGVAVVDLGCGMTNVSIYTRGVLRYLASIPIGSSALNTDIRSLMIQDRMTEAVKCAHGVAVADMAEEGSFEVEGRKVHETRKIPYHNLAVAIQERMTDITIFVHREIRDANFMGRLPYGIVLTGGGAKLRGVDELFRRNLDMEVRIGLPEEGIGGESLNLVASPEYATVVGLLRRGVEIDSKGFGVACVAEEESEEESDFKRKLEEQQRIGGGSYQERVAQSEKGEQWIGNDKTTTHTDEPQRADEPEVTNPAKSIWNKMAEAINEFFSTPDRDQKL